MAVLSGATASGRLMYSIGSIPTTLTTVYTAPSASSNVTSPSATAYVKEIIICNTTSSSATVSVVVDSVYILSSITINSYDSKILSGLNTMLNASSVIQIQANVANISIAISGVEIQ